MQADRMRETRRQNMNVKRRDFLKSAGLGAAALSTWPFVSSCSRSGRRPNIVLIMADDVGYEGFGCYGSTTYRTPHIDRLAETGVRFDRCYATPLCTPSRVQLMTGKYNFRNYGEFGGLPPGETTFAHLLRDAGYKTYVAGKWQLSGRIEGANYQGPGTSPRDAGFDDFCLWQVDRVGSRYWDPVLNANGHELEGLEGEYGPDVVCDHLMDFIRAHQDERFFVYYPMILVHSPFVPPPSTDPSPEERFSADRKHFKGMIEHLDRIVGRIVIQLEELGLAEDTLILFSGDNGTARGISSNLRSRTIVGDKGETTDAGTHVPLVLNWKGHSAEGAICDDLVDFTDFLPTLLDAAGTESPPDFPVDGRSFLPQVLGKRGNPRDWVFCHYDPRWGNWSKRRYVQNKEWKLYDDGRLFDLGKDILEKNPVDVREVGPEVQRILNEFEAVLSRMK